VLAEEGERERILHFRSAPSAFGRDLAIIDLMAQFKNLLEKNRRRDGGREAATLILAASQFFLSMFASEVGDIFEGILTDQHFESSWFFLSGFGYSDRSTSEVISPLFSFKLALLEISMTISWLATALLKSL